MTTPSLRDQVFISYSHKDSDWLERLRTMLAPLVRRGTIDLWDDSRIQSGRIWREEIDQALVRARVAVLLVSDHFLASDFIAKHELPPLLEAQKQAGLTVLWVPLRYSFYDETEIGAYQAVHSPEQPLETLPEPAQNRILHRLGKEIRDAVTRVQPQPLDSARLQFGRGGTVGLTRVFTRSMLRLGRPKCRADLWLPLYPLDDPARQAQMDAFSESHAELRLEGGAAVRDCGSRTGVRLDGRPVGQDWIALGDDAVLNLGADALQLRARCDGGKWLHLSRRNNGAGVEDYLLLRGRILLGDSGLSLGRQQFPLIP